VGATRFPGSRAGARPSAQGQGRDREADRQAADGHAQLAHRKLLLEEGFVYNSHDTLDHLPHYVSAADGSKPLLNLPFHYAIDDAMFSFAWLKPRTRRSAMDPDHVEEIWWAAFLQQYQQGGYLNICMHPFVSGRALRIAMLERLIGRMKALPGVWFPTCEQVARHARHPSGPLGRTPCPGKSATRSAMSAPFSTPTCAGPAASAAASRVVVDLAPASGPEGINPQDLTTPDAYFGMHGGLRELCGTLKRYSIKATFAVPAVIAEIHGDTVRRLHDEVTRSRPASSMRM
jgi:peptidoglycan/xylan/chitin deacetylase (PgdA/CDA1 family)